MRRFLFFPFFFILISSFLYAKETTSFTPLAYNERFAYSLQQLEGNRRVWNRMTLYAVRNNNIENLKELFSWESVVWSDIQFSGDLKKVFFIEQLFIGNYGANVPLIHNLYIANGQTGEIRRLITDMGGSSFRVTSNGRFVLLHRPDPRNLVFERLYNYNIEFVQLLLFDVEKEVIVGEFEWTIERPLEERVGLRALHPMRFGNTFKIYETGEKGIIRAAAELDTAAMELRTLWDYTNMPEFPSVPNVIDDNWVDDVILSRENPDVFLGWRR